MKWTRAFFRLLNKYLMVPIFRLGFGSLMGNPITSYVMVLKTTGRKSGKIRYAPVNYAIQDGYIYCLAGFGPKTHWYLNLKANPKLEVILPGRAFSGEVEEITDPKEGLPIVRQVIKNAGIAGFLEGYNPFKPTEEQLKKTFEKAPLLRIRQTGIGSGPADPQGWLWISFIFITIIAVCLLIAS